MMREPDFVDECYADKDLSLLKKLTIVIPTYNRNYYLSRCLWYHAHFPFGEIIVADSSPEEKKVVNRETVAKVREMFGANVRYLEYEPETEKYGGDIYRKWGDAVQHVETEYSLSCADKEFLIPTTVAESIRFLIDHPDYSIADGRYYLIESKALIYPWQGNLSLTSDDPIKRLQEAFASNTPFGTQFAVQRVSIHKKIYNNLERFDLYDLRFGETEVELMPIINGKTHRNCDIPMSCRDCIHEYHRGLFNIKIKGRKSESSFSRYNIVKDYPELYRLEMQKRLQLCIENNFSKEQTGEISEYTKKIIIQRYGDGVMRNSILNRFKLLRFCWNSLFPYRLKLLLSKHLGLGMVQQPLKKKYYPDEIRLILRIILHTDKFWESDSIISISLEKI
ncbi:MAG: TIGR00180 family glycosyltransferase [Dysgonamonadaceae bacterium]|nr:TIGR00180 family glycosyltransferase [Dysgonamonadaceae bacterium]